LTGSTGASIAPHRPLTSAHEMLRLLSGVLKKIEMLVRLVSSSHRDIETLP
jgi:hypothetical protein